MSYTKKQKDQIFLDYCELLDDLEYWEKNCDLVNGVDLVKINELENALGWMHGLVYDAFGTTDLVKITNIVNKI